MAWPNNEATCTHSHKHKNTTTVQVSSTTCTLYVPCGQLVVCTLYCVVQAVVAEADVRLAEMKKLAYEYERDVVRGAVNPVSEPRLSSMYLCIRSNIFTFHFLTAHGSDSW